LLVADFDALCCWRSECLFPLWCSCALRCTREVHRGLCCRHGGCGSSKGFETTRGAAAWRSKTVGCLDENVVRSLDERRERLLGENDDFLNTNMKWCFFSIQLKFHQTIQLSNNFSFHLLFPHPTIQQLFIPSSISSSNYPTTFHPM
jgi:hypothetical protein